MEELEDEIEEKTKRLTELKKDQIQDFTNRKRLSCSANFTPIVHRNFFILESVELCFRA